MRKYISIVFVLIAMSLVLACKHEIPQPEISPVANGNQNPGIDTLMNTCSPDTVYFEQDILPIFIGSCAISGCHDEITQEDGVVLTSFQNVMNSNEIEPGDPADSDLYLVLLESDPDDQMPPPGNAPLTNDQIQSIQTWIAQGALNNSCSSGCDLSSVSYQIDILPIVETFCDGCHSNTNPDAGLSLTSYQDISSIALDGRFLNVLNGTNGFEIMPLNSNGLNDCSKQQIEIWINEGALQN